MIWSLPEYNAPPDVEEIYNKKGGRNDLDVALMGNSRRDEIKGMIIVEGNGMVESSVFDPHENDVERNMEYRPSQ